MLGREALDRIEGYTGAYKSGGLAETTERLTNLAMDLGITDGIGYFIRALFILSKATGAAVRGTHQDAKTRKAIEKALS